MTDSQVTDSQEAAPGRAPVRDNVALSRFELEEQGETAFASYCVEDGAMIFLSTQTPPALRGRGVASALIRAALLAARARGLKVASRCAFVAGYLARHPEFSDLTA